MLPIIAGVFEYGYLRYERRKTSSRPAENNYSQRCSMKKILLVDDEEQLTSIMANVLQDEGFFVKTMPSAEEALKAYLSFSPDLVISDVKMERMDGFTMFERVKALQSSRSVPFIFLTGLDDRLGQQRASTMGATAYVNKPFDVDEFVGIVKRIVPPA